MHLITLGAFELRDSAFGRPKPLLLLAYLALEGPKNRRYLGELFWGESANPMSSLRVALSQLRKGAPGAVAEDGQRLASTVSCDASVLLESLDVDDLESALAAYGGPFLEGVQPNMGVELEEWTYATREYLAERLRRRLLQAGERDAGIGDFRLAGTRARAALQLAGAPPPEPDDLERIHRLLLAAGDEKASDLQQAAREYGIDLDDSRQSARSSLAPEGFPGRPVANNLPHPAGDFVGRDPEQLELARLLEDETQRIVTVTGPGGVGKTRLALELAHLQVRQSSFPGGVYFVPLDSLTDVNLVPQAIATALEIERSGDAPPLQDLVEALRDSRTLLILDNCEHLSGMSEIAGRLLATCPGLRLLVTSRDRLHLPAEQLFPLDGLAGSEFADSDAIRLFLKQARRVRPGFEPDAEELSAIGRLCALVYGFPLGIELAAARMRLMTPQSIALELERDLDFLERAPGGSNERHAGLRATFEYSWKLLTPAEQATLRKLSVFTGGFGREAASRVAGATIPLLAALVDKSLLRTDDGGRFHRHPLIYRYTVGKLAQQPDEEERVREEHARSFVDLVEEADRYWAGAQQRTWLDRLEREQGNLQSALEWAFVTGTGGGSSVRAELGLRLVVGLYRYWYYRNHWTEGRRWLELAIERSNDLGPELLELRSKAMHAAGVLADEQGDSETAKQMFDLRLELAIEAGDVLGQALSINSLGVIALGRQEYARARELFGRSLDLRLQLGRKELLPGPRLNLGLIALALDDLESAQEEFEQCLLITRETGNEMLSATALTNLGAVFIDRGMPDQARNALEDAVEHYRSLGNRDGLAHCLDGFAAVSALRGSFELAARLAGGAASLREAVGAAGGPVERGERRLARARAGLGEARFEKLWQEGFSAGYEPALVEALQATTGDLQKPR